MKERIEEALKEAGEVDLHAKMQIVFSILLHRDLAGLPSIQEIIAIWRTIGIDTPEAYVTLWRERGRGEDADKEYRQQDASFDLYYFWGLPDVQVDKIIGGIWGEVTG